MRSTDVFIAGGGPAGLAAAIACRLAGFGVTVADCARPPIDKACGEGLLHGALAALESLGVALDTTQTGEFRGIRFVEGSRSVAAVFPSGVARGVRRTHLHARLQERAAALGVEFLWQTQVLGLKLCEDSVTVRTTAGPAQARWVIGADGLNSRVRLWSGLDRGAAATKRIGLRAHFGVAPWTDYTEVHWADFGQAYITPIAPDEIGLAIVARTRKSLRSFDDALRHFPALSERLRDAPRTSEERGSATVTRRLARVTSRQVALIGDASGSVDAVTGEGLGLAFQQALALASALRQNDLAAYEEAHREICRRPAFMSRALLLLDRYPALRRFSFAAFGRGPELFQRMLAIHTGEAPFRLLGSKGALSLGLELLRS